MPPAEPDAAPPQHPVRESVGFATAVLAALGQLFWPARRRTPAGTETPASEAEPVELDLAERIDCVAPYPVDD